MLEFINNQTNWYRSKEKQITISIVAAKTLQFAEQLKIHEVRSKRLGPMEQICAALEMCTEAVNKFIMIAKEIKKYKINEKAIYINGGTNNTNANSINTNAIRKTSLASITETDLQATIQKINKNNQ